MPPFEFRMTIFESSSGGQVSNGGVAALRAFKIERIPQFEIRHLPLIIPDRCANKILSSPGLSSKTAFRDSRYGLRVTGCGVTAGPTRTPK